MPLVYCPKCSQPVVEREGIWRCSSGELEFSRSLGARLYREFGLSSSPGRVPSGSPGPTDWFCPCCCVRLGEDMSCPECGRTLVPYRFELIEFHPHGGPDGFFCALSFKLGAA